MTVPCSLYPTPSPLSAVPTTPLCSLWERGLRVEYPSRPLSLAFLGAAWGRILRSLRHSFPPVVTIVTAGIIRRSEVFCLEELHGTVMTTLRAVLVHCYCELQGLSGLTTAIYPFRHPKSRCVCVYICEGTHSH